MWFQTLGSTMEVCVGCNGRHRAVLGPQAGGTIQGGVQGVPGSCRSATPGTASSSGCDSFYNRHSPHRRCYMLKNLPHEVRKTQESFITSKLNSLDKDKIRKTSVLSVQTSTVLLHSNGNNPNNTLGDKQTNNPVTNGQQCS